MLQTDKMILSERKYRDQRKLEDFIKNHSVKDDHLFVLYTHAITVSDSLRRSIEKFKWYEFKKKITYRFIGRPKYLLKKLPVSDLLMLSEKVKRIEGNEFKKKVNPERK